MKVKFVCTFDAIVDGMKYEKTSGEIMGQLDVDHLAHLISKWLDDAPESVETRRASMHRIDFEIESIDVQQFVGLDHFINVYLKSRRTEGT